MKLHTKSITEIFTATLAALSIFTVLSYGYTANIYGGYMSHWHIPLQSFSYWPDIHDMTILGVAGVAAIIILLAMMAGGVYLALLTGNFLANPLISEKAANTLSEHVPLRTLKNIARFLNIAVIVIVLSGVLYLILSTLYVVAPQIGRENAAKMTEFPVVASTANLRTWDVIVFQQGNSVAIKQYDQQTRTFSDTYELRDIHGTKLVQKRIYNIEQK
jgi:hypothetical protein